MDRAPWPPHPNGVNKKRTHRDRQHQHRPPPADDTGSVRSTRLYRERARVRAPCTKSSAWMATRKTARSPPPLPAELSQISPWRTALCCGALPDRIFTALAGQRTGSIQQDWCRCGPRATPRSYGRWRRAAHIRCGRGGRWVGTLPDVVSRRLQLAAECTIEDETGIAESDRLAGNPRMLPTRGAGHSPCCAAPVNCSLKET